MSSSAKPRRQAPVLASGAAVCGLLLVSIVEAAAQEAVRASLAGQAAAEARQRAIADHVPNLKLGPVGLRFSSQVSAEYNDNVDLVKDNPECDLILRPQLNVSGVWRLTKKNSLTFATGVGYQYYVAGTENNTVYLTPGTGFSFDFYVEDFIITIYDRFSYTPNVANDPQASGVGTEETLDNTAGTTVTWDLNQAVVRFGYDYSIHKVMNSDTSNDDRSQNLLNLSGGLRVRPTTLVGVQVSGGFTDNKGSENPDNTHIAEGLFYDAQISQYLTLRASAGYVSYFFDSASSSSTLDDDDVSLFYFDVSLQQRVSEYYSHSVSAGRSLQAGFYNDTTETIFAYYSATWQLFRKTGFRYSLSYENYEDTQDDSDSGQRVGFGVGLSRSLMQKLGASLDYHYYQKFAKEDSEDYTQNQLVLTLAYSF